jgi:acyl dehydratase
VTTVAHGLDGLRKLAGTDLGPSDWLEITQERVNAFADATGDHSGSTSTPNARAAVRSAAPSPTATSPWR